MMIINDFVVRIHVKSIDLLKASVMYRQLSTRQHTIEQSLLFSKHHGGNERRYKNMSLA